MNPQDATNDAIGGKAFQLAELLNAREESQRAYLEFLRVPSLSMGLYALPAGGVDPQKPHTEDEVYFVVSGRASMRVGEEDFGGGAGCVGCVWGGGVERLFDIW